MRRTHHRSRRRHGGEHLGAGDSEVSHLRDAVGSQEDVLGLYVAMYDAQRVGFSQAIGDLDSELGDAVQTHLATGLDDAGEADAQTVRWTALAVGDACLLHVRKHDVMMRFPIENAEAFGTTPALLSTHLQHDKSVLEDGALRHYGGICQAGDLFLLATDAMAEWLYGLADLNELKLGWESISTLIEEDFEALIEELRTQSIIRNDDVTLLVLRVAENGET